MSRRSMSFHETGKAAETPQAELFHDTVLDACGSVVNSIGGVKRAACLLWPNDPMVRAEQRLRECLNGDRPQRFSPDELMRLMRLGREAGDHSIMNYLAAELGYNHPTPIDPDDQRAERERQFLAGLQRLEQLAKRLQR